MATQPTPRAAERSMAKDKHEHKTSCLTLQSEVAAGTSAPLQRKHRWRLYLTTPTDVNSILSRSDIQIEETPETEILGPQEHTHAA